MLAGEVDLEAVEQTEQAAQAAGAQAAMARAQQVRQIWVAVAAVLDRHWAVLVDRVL
jgi:hypothetical protein